MPLYGQPRKPENAPMKTVANFDRIGEENAFAVLARANALAAQGRDIINLGIGQPVLTPFLESLSNGQAGSDLD